MDHFPNNKDFKGESIKSSRDRRRVNAVKGKVKPQNFIDKLIVSNPIDVAEDVFKTTIVPRLKMEVYNYFQECIRRIMFGGDSMAMKGSYTPYNRMSPLSQPGQTTIGISSKKGKKAYKSIRFENSCEAGETLAFMKTVIAEDGAASIQDFLEFVGRSEDGDYTTNDYGWTNLDGVQIGVSIGDGMYYINFPKPVRLK